MNIQTNSRALLAMALAMVLCAAAGGCRRAPDRLYASAEMGTKLIQVDVQEAGKITTKLIGQTGTVGCISMALSPSGAETACADPASVPPGRSSSR